MIHETEHSIYHRKQPSRLAAYALFAAAGLFMAFLAVGGL